LFLIWSRPFNETFKLTASFDSHGSELGAIMGELAALKIK